VTSAERLEEIRARHPLEESGVDLCGQAWPCDAAVALAEVERLRATCAASRRLLDGVIAAESGPPSPEVEPELHEASRWSMLSEARHILAEVAPEESAVTSLAALEGKP